MKRGDCTCAGTAPGYPQHESYCGQDEDTEFEGLPDWWGELEDVDGDED